MIFGQDQKVEFKKTFDLWRQISLRVLTKVALNFVYFTRHGQTGAKQSKYFMKFLISLAKFSRIKQKFMVLHEILLNSMKFHFCLQY